MLSVVSSAGDDFPNAESLLEALFDLSEKTNSTSQEELDINKTSSSGNDASNQNNNHNNRCKLCGLNEINTVFLPCGHLITCSQCGASKKNCPVCKATISRAVKVFLSWKKAFFQVEKSSQPHVRKWRKQCRLSVSVEEGYICKKLVKNVPLKFIYL